MGMRLDVCEEVSEEEEELITHRIEEVVSDLEEFQTNKKAIDQRN